MVDARNAVGASVFQLGAPRELGKFLQSAGKNLFGCPIQEPLKGSYQFYDFYDVLCILHCSWCLQMILTCIVPSNESHRCIDTSLYLDIFDFISGCDFMFR